MTAEHRVQRAGTWLLRAGNNDRMLARPSLPLVLVSPLMDRPATLFTATRSGLDFESRTRSFVPSLSISFLPLLLRFSNLKQQRKFKGEFKGVGETGISR